MAAQEVVIPYRPHPASALRAGQPIRGLHPQQAFHEDRYRVKYRAAFAGTGGGKTAAAAFEAVSWALENPGCVQLLGEPDYPMVQRVLLPALEDLIGPVEASPLVKAYNKVDHRIEWRNRSVTWLISLSDPGKLEGPNVDYVWADEIRLLRNWPEVWKAVVRRLRGSRPKNRVGAVFTTHSPTKDQVAAFEGPGVPADRACYRWGTLDNPLLSADYLREVAAAHSGPAAKAVLMGEWAQAEGRVFSEFITNTHIVQPPDVPLPEWTATPEANRKPRWTERVTYGVDWGFTLPACIIVAAWAGSRTVLVDEVYGTGYSTMELIDAAHSLVKKWGPGRFICGHDRPEHIKEFREAGLDAVSIQGIKGAFHKQDGLSIMNSMFKSRELGVTPACKHWLWEEERYVHKPGSEEPEKGNDHAIDASRYAIMGERARPRLTFGTVSSR